MSDVLLAAPPQGTPSIWQPAAQQQAFRALLDAFAYPGRVIPFGTAHTPALRLVLATLIDAATTLADPCGLVDADELRRLGARTTAPQEAQFVVVPGTHPPGWSPCLGTLENPEQGATVIVAVEALDAGAAWTLSGPGINGQTQLRVSGLDPLWWPLRTGWNASFPMGVDLLLVSRQHVVALPRTTRTHLQGEH